MKNWIDRFTALPTTDPGDFSRMRKLAIRVSGTYLVVSIAWITISDRILRAMARGTGDPGGIITAFQSVKGIFFTSLTAVVFYFLIRAFTRSILRAAQASRDLTEQYQMLFERNPFAMWVYDPTTLNVVAVNERAVASYGYTREEFLALSIAELRPTEDIPQLMVWVTDISPDVVKFRSAIHKRKDGSLLSVEVVTRQILFNGITGRLVLALDITERRKAEKTLAEYRAQLEQRVAARTADLSAANSMLQEQIEKCGLIEKELRSAKQLAEEASVAKSIFLANTTHEIRTPLTSILGYADLLVDRGLPMEERDRFIAIVRQNAGHLLKMIDDLLDLSRIETGNLRVTLSDHSALELAKQTIEPLRQRAEEKRLTLSLAASEHIPDVIRTDGVRLRQVLLNLLSNAIKFTHSGGVSLVIERGAADMHEGSGEWLMFQVSDTGIGIAGDQLVKIFAPFYQIDHGENRRFAGTGLGLAISKRLVEQMGGTLSVSSELGRGSTFTVMIPLAARQGAEGSSEPRILEAMSIEGHILLAEDNANIRWLVEEYLRRAGATVAAVPDGAAAVSTIERALAGRKIIDLVLMDISMPGMDGIEALHRMRKAGYRGPIVALTAHVPSEDPSAWSKAGWDAVVAKPINQQTFIPLIAELIHERRLVVT